jgi:hypothetical protein
LLTVYFFLLMTALIIIVLYSVRTLRVGALRLENTDVLHKCVVIQIVYPHVFMVTSLFE